MTYMLFDGNSIGYAAQSTAPLKTADGREVQAIFQTLKMIKHLKEKFTDYPNAMILWDGRAQFRYDLYPEYKGKRSDTPEKVALKASYSSQMPDIEMMLSFLGVTQVVSPLFEADDLAGFFVRRATAAAKRSTLITGDQDWLQLINSYTQWHDPRNKPGRSCDRNTFHEFTGCQSVSQFLSVKCLTGDTSDTITGVGGIGEKTAAGIIANYGSTAELLKWHKENGPFVKDNIPEDLRRSRKKLNDFCDPDGNGQKLFRRNLSLMSLVDGRFDDQILQTIKINRGKKDLDAFKEKCAELSFFSIIRQINEWQKTFEV